MSMMDNTETAEQECQFVSGMRLPGEKLPKIHPDYATDGLTEPLKREEPADDKGKVTGA